ncbi:hypothetical protein [Chelatococcus asaccharovorans]|uniref:Uncharacterized protein n=1 Tax=Chelatococcus asaccharovorans TaxID=28210 RepID=A0A2V3TSG7_9HYPH|nr:hypothetical protein [Chelatococcus asaccharovorans]MBS7703118.1 hypothetical protein [Chelatococcus asaccharovorans]PXW50741.1 hypothetical protein C7450_12313 [Chelatococcus asaccharovorans]CAH1673132.1 conserved hypothetical protein [Chelatococcus asaccharovorans]
MTVLRFPNRPSRRTYEEEFLRLCALRREIDAQLDQLVEMVSALGDEDNDGGGPRVTMSLPGRGRHGLRVV